MSDNFKFKGERPDDIFEAITVMAQQARKINAERSELYPINSYVDTETEEILDDDIDYDALEKPTTMAMKDYIDGKIDFKYVNNEVPDSESGDDSE